ncbi:hypothetical protein Pla100_34940 [Neorhodopirellula pilleata]|uniref:Uncharacterized protein n=1 Tax=Neorhodopirellula pilleata TaxID=2714738 RepID=A0A5C6A5Y7_9BACT|nr:hypothetical protein Pla100_34940 [Neorhodopirellula pilleata]
MTTQAIGALLMPLRKRRTAMILSRMTTDTYLLVPFGPSTTAWVEYYALC